MPNHEFVKQIKTYNDVDCALRSACIRHLQSNGLDSVLPQDIEHMEFFEGKILFKYSTVKGTQTGEFPLEKLDEWGIDPYNPTKLKIWVGSTIDRKDYNYRFVWFSIEVERCGRKVWAKNKERVRVHGSKYKEFVDLKRIELREKGLPFTEGGLFAPHVEYNISFNEMNYKTFKDIQHDLRPWFQGLKGHKKLAKILGFPGQLP